MPRHRRRRRIALPWLVGPVLLALAAVWGVNQITAPADAPGADQTAESARDEYDPLEQSELPGEPIGEVDGRYTMWIPRLGIHAPIIPVVSDAERVLLPPRDPLIAGWWRDGAAPGDEQGTAVVVGHAVDGGESAFNDVPTLQVADTILVTGGRPLTWYRISSVDVLSRADLADGAEDLFAQDVPGRLVIVTCDDWDGTAFQSNVVVTAEPI